MDKHLKALFDITCNGKADSSAHALSLFSIALSLKAKRILELGVRDGDSSYPLLCAAYANNGMLWSVDKRDTTYKPPKDIRQAEAWRFIKGDVIEILEEWTVLQDMPAFDLVYLDDWHSYEHVAKELVLLDKLVSPRTVILVHDLMYATEPYYHTDLTLKEGQWANGGPYRALAELDPQFWEFSTIPSSNGLTILRKKYSGIYHR